MPRRTVVRHQGTPGLLTEYDATLSRGPFSSTLSLSLTVSVGAEAMLELLKPGSRLRLSTPSARHPTGQEKFIYLLRRPQQHAPVGAGTRQSGV